MTKELEVELRIRNNRLKSRRTALGFTQRQLAQAAGLCAHAYGGLESLRDSPLTPKGQWRVVARALADFFEVPLEELFPPALLSLPGNSATRAVDVCDLPALTGGDEDLKALPQESETSRTLAEEAALRVQVRKVIKTLTPREAKIICMRFGIDEPGLAGKAAEQKFEVSRGRIHQIEAKALRKLRHRTRRDLLEPFFREPNFSDESES